MEVTKTVYRENTKLEHTVWYNENGRRHREDGPAIKYKMGYEEWYLNGKRYDKDKHQQLIFKINLEKLNGTI